MHELLPRAKAAGLFASFTAVVVRNAGKSLQRTERRNGKKPRRVTLPTNYKERRGRVPVPDLRKPLRFG